MKRPVFKKSSALDGASKPTESSSGADFAGKAHSEMNSPFDAAEEETAAVETNDSEVDSALPVTEEPSEQNSGDDTETGVDREYVARLEGEVKENYDKYLRAAAELENFKKRAIRERADILKYSGESLARDLLEIVDNFQLALSHNVEGVNEEFLKGIRMIHDRFQAILEQHSVKGETSLGGSFDPNKHQALASVPTADRPPGTILEEFKRAYFLKDKLLRPAQVVVAAADPAAENGEKSEVNSENNA